MSKAGEILHIDPAAGIPGGEGRIECAGFDTSEPSRCAVWFDGEVAPMVAASPKRVLAIAPEGAKSSGAHERISPNAPEPSKPRTPTEPTNAPAATSARGPQPGGTVAVTLE